MNCVRNLVLIVLAFTAGVVSEVSAFSLDFGITAASYTLFISEHDGTDLGKMNEGNQYYPYLSSRFAQKDGQWGNWGYFYGFDIGSFKISKQSIDGSTVEKDLGTEVDGLYAYFTPTLFYDFLGSIEDTSLVFGIGAGVGYLDVSGDAVLTEALIPQSIDIDASRANSSIGIYLEFQKAGWLLKATSYGPAIKNGDYKFQLTDVKVVFARRFTF